MRTHTIAVAKGRILSAALPLLERAGITPLEDPARSRKLVLETTDPSVKLVIVRATDVPTYTDFGAADLGVTGKDVLLEHQGDGLYEPLDLGIARCRLMVAGRVGTEVGPRFRVATKYAHTTRAYFAQQGQQIELIKLYGSMELAPIVGLADRIVDLVDTGNTLKANGLAPLEHIADISARLIVNKAAMKTDHRAVSALVERIERAAHAKDPREDTA